MNMPITEEFKAKLISILDKGIVTGLGKREPGSFCVEAAVCYALGEPHGDSPSCVAQPDRDLMVRLNDSYPGTPTARAAALRNLALAHLGTIGTDRTAWSKRVALDTIRTILPIALDAAASAHTDVGHQKELRAAALKCAQAHELDVADACADACAAARAAARAGAASTAADYASTAADYASTADAAYYAYYASAAAAVAVATAADYAAAAATAADYAAVATAADYASTAASAAADYAAAAADYAAVAAAADYAYYAYYAATAADDAYATAAASAAAAAASADESAAYYAADAADATGSADHCRKRVMDKFIAIVERAYTECPH